MKTVNYKGFQASVDYEDGALFVRVLHIDDVLIAQVETASEVPKALAELIEAYLQDCKDLGKTPQKPFSGSFNVRMDRDLHRRAAMAAAQQGASLNAWVEDAVAQKVECDRFSDRVNTVLNNVQSEVRLLHVAATTQETAWRAGGTAHVKREFQITDLSALVEFEDTDWVN